MLVSDYESLKSHNVDVDWMTKAPEISSKHYTGIKSRSLMKSLLKVAELQWDWMEWTSVRIKGTLWLKKKTWQDNAYVVLINTLFTHTLWAKMYLLFMRSQVEMLKEQESLLTKWLAILGCLISGYAERDQSITERPLQLVVYFLFNNIHEKITRLTDSSAV